MKIIVSHDVDHITVWEHRHDLIVPKYLVRNVIELMMRTSSISECKNRIRDVIRNKWQNVEALAVFDLMNDVKSTFFIGVAQGMGLSYNLEHASHWIEYLARRGFEVGVHGICYNDQQGIASEYETFRNILKSDKIGVRNHYLRSTKNTLLYQASAGYLYDASMHGIDRPFRVGSMWEIPLDIMDGWLFCGNRRWKIHGVDEAKEMTMRTVDAAVNAGKKFFSVLFHDRYFCDSYSDWMEWYVWFVDWCIKNRVLFVSHGDAVRELNELS